jgi:gamma-glutamylcyclotransferase (GGCT)/AIG2-like uncharacterized protein YtfP
MKQLFVYGTLMFPEIREKLTGKAFKTSPAVLSGYRRTKVKDADYPAIVKNPDSEVEGILLEDVDEQTIEILSFFEGDEYKTQHVEVFSGNRKIPALTFVWANRKKLLPDEDWDLTEFEAGSLKLYVKKIVPETVARFRQKL